MSERALRVAAVPVALAGIATTAYLLSVRTRGGELLCSTGGCETVQNSKYAEVAGLPVAGLGLVGFAALLMLFLLPGTLAEAAGLAVVLAAFAFAAYLLGLQLFVLHAVCDLCLASDAALSALAALAVLRIRSTWKGEDDERSNRRHDRRRR